MSAWDRFFIDPGFPLVLVGLLLALLVIATVAFLRWREERAGRTMTILWDTYAADLPYEVYRPEDIRVGVDISPHTGREVVVIAARDSNGVVHIAMAHERTSDDE